MSSKLPDNKPLEIIAASVVVFVAAWLVLYELLSSATLPEYSTPTSTAAWFAGIAAVVWCFYSSSSTDHDG